MGTPVILRPRLPLAVGFNQESPEIGDQVVNLLHLIFPPLRHGGIQGIGVGESAQNGGRREVDRHVNPDVVRP